MTSNTKYLAIDVGGSAIKYGVVHEDLTITDQGEYPTPQERMEDLLEVYRKIYAECGAGTAGVGISFTATMDPSDGYVFDGGLARYTKDKNLLPIFQEVFPVPVAVENDGNCGALAEGRHGSLKDCDAAISINLGSGIGGGLLYKGNIMRGKRSCSGEFSYIITNYGDPNQAVWAAHNGRMGLGPVLAKKKGLPEMNGREFFEYANSGDPEALEVLKTFTDFLAIQIFNLQCIYAPDKVSISGGISRQPLLMEYLQKSLDTFYEHGPNMPRAEVVLSHFQNEGNLIGAVCWLKDCMN